MNILEPVQFNFINKKFEASNGPLGVIVYNKNKPIAENYKVIISKKRFDLSKSNNKYVNALFEQNYDIAFCEHCNSIRYITNAGVCFNCRKPIGTNNSQSYSISELIGEPHIKKENNVISSITFPFYVSELPEIILNSEINKKQEIGLDIVKSSPKFKNIYNLTLTNNGYCFEPSNDFSKIDEILYSDFHNLIFDSYCVSLILDIKKIIDNFKTPFLNKYKKYIDNCAENKVSLPKIKDFCNLIYETDPLMCEILNKELYNLYFSYKQELECTKNLNILKITEQWYNYCALFNEALWNFAKKYNINYKAFESLFKITQILKSDNNSLEKYLEIFKYQLIDSDFEYLQSINKIIPLMNVNNISIDVLISQIEYFNKKYNDANLCLYLMLLYWTSLKEINNENIKPDDEIFEILCSENYNNFTKCSESAGLL